MFDCFISYKVGADDVLAHNFASFLKDDDFSVFIDKKGLLPGTNWSNELAQSMEKSNHVLAFFTEEYIARIEQGNNDGQNFIIEELNWALKDKKLIPISVGVPVNVIEEKCSKWVKDINGIQFIAFENKESVQYQTILNQLNKLIRTSNKNSLLSPTASRHNNAQELNSQEAYLKINMPWPTNEALKYKADLENKFLKEPIDYVVLAKFHLLGRFGIKIDPEVAYQHLQKSALTNCREANFELGILYEFEDNKYGGDEDKATEYYTKAHQAGDIRATYRLAVLFDDNIENSNCPTQFLKNKYGIENSNEFTNHILEQKSNYASFNLQDKYTFCRAQIHANENKELAIEEIHQLASKGYLSAVGWLGYEYSKNDNEIAQDTQKSLTYLHAGDEQGDIWCRKYLACIYLETEYRTLGFEENIESGVEKHLKNISLNAFDSAYDLAWVLDNRSELQQHISNNEQIEFLEKAVDFGQLNCREFLAKAYIKTKHLSLSTFLIKTAQQGYFEPTLLMLVEFSVNNKLRGAISEDDYPTLYALCKKEIQTANPERAEALNILLMNWAMGYNRLQDALDLVVLVSEENKKEGAHCYYAKKVALKGFTHSQQLVFELLKKGVELGEVNCKCWLVLISLGRINRSYLPMLKDCNFQYSFLNEVNRADFKNALKCLASSKVEVVNDQNKIVNVPIDECIEGVITIQEALKCAELLSTKDCTDSDNNTEILSRFINFTILDKPIISFVSIRIRESLGHSPRLPAPEYINFKKIKSYPFLCNDDYNNTFDLSLACYKKLFVESSIKHGYQAQGALYTFIAYLIGTSNVPNNEEQIQKFFQQLNYDANKKLYDETSLKVKVYLNIEEQFIVPFIWLFLQFFGSSQTQESPWFYQNAEMLFLTLARNVKDQSDSKRISHFKPIIADAITYLQSDRFSDYRKKNEQLDNVLNELYLIKN